MDASSAARSNDSNLVWHYRPRLFWPELFSQNFVVRHCRDADKSLAS
jgi:hypothetical protein